MENKEFLMAKAIAEKVASAGGTVYFVGGFVRDRILGRDTKDVDIEIHGIPAEKLEEILDTLGERTSFGLSFGIYSLRHYSLDIAMPRQEKATGRGHRDFTVFVDPFIGVRKAATRRDFTMNALMQNVLTDEIIDEFGGISDIENRVIRHVNDDTFVEDPLRALRAAQFASRFGFSIAEETRNICARMDLTALPKERITGEAEKALLQSKKPSVFFEEMRRMNQLSYWFKEVQDLISVPQDQTHHPEGDVWQHTMRVLDAAAARRDGTENPIGFMYAALCHDFGKITTTYKDEKGAIRSIGHEKEGLPIVETFLRRITDETRLIKYVLAMTELHMRPNMLVADHAGKKAYMRLYDIAQCPSDLISLSRCDREGQLKSQEENDTYENTQREMLKEYEKLQNIEAVTGEDLMQAGLKPGKDFKTLLDFAHNLWLSAVPRNIALKETMKYYETLKK